MLQYSIERVTRLEGTPTVIYCSGWLVDPAGAEVRIKLADNSEPDAAVDVIRVPRPDVKKLFRRAAADCGFELEITCGKTGNLELVFAGAADTVSIPVPELEAGMSRIEISPTVKAAMFRQKCKSFIVFLLVWPIIVMKLFKNCLFKLFPPFQQFYLRRIYPLLHPGFSYTPPKTATSECRTSPWGEHILLVSHFADGSGAPVLALNIARTLYGFGFNLHIVVMRYGELYDSFCQFGTVDVINSEEGLRTRLGEWERESIHIRKAFLNTTLAGIFAGVLKEYGMTVVNLIHEMPDTVRVMGQYEASAVLRKNADRIVLPSSLLIDLWEEDNMPLPRERCVILPQPDYHSDLEPPADGDEKRACHAALCRELDIPEDSYIVIGCGTLETRKAPDVFFQTAGEVCREDRRVHFVWIGDSGDIFFRKKIDLMQKMCPDNTRMLSYRNLNKYYRGADLFFLPSKEDPFPTVGLLAAKVGIPVVFCRRSTGLRDLFGDVEGCSSAEYSKGIFKTLILQLAADRWLSARRGAAFQQIYREKMYSFRQYVQSLYELAGDPLPRITAIVPNYNYAKFLPARVRTVADQTFPVYELLILDDCSADDSAEVAEKLIRQYADRFPGGMRYVPGEHNSGVFRQWFKGVSMAKGDFIWIAEADDMCQNTMQSQLVHAFRDPLVKIAYAQSALIDGKDVVYSKTFLQHTNCISQRKWLRNYIWDAGSEIETALAVKNTIPNASSALIRKSAFAQIPEEIFDFKVVGDWFAYLHLIAGGKVAFCAEPLNLYRRHPGSVVAKNPEQLLEELTRIRALIQEKFAVSEHTKYQMQCEFDQTCQLLKLSLKGFGPASEPVEEKRPTDYWLLPEDVDWEAFRAEIARSKAAYLFVCFIDDGATLPSQVAEAFAGSIHVFWRDELKSGAFRDKFKLWENPAADAAG